MTILKVDLDVIDIYLYVCVHIFNNIFNINNNILLFNTNIC